MNTSGNMIRIRRLLVIVFIGLIPLTNARAQSADTALLRKYGVVKIESWLKLPMLPRQKDSCLSEERKMNEQGKVTYIKSNYGCMGWERLDETYFTYNPQGLPLEIKLLSNGNILAVTRYAYDNKNSIIREERYSFEPFDTVIYNYTPVYDKEDRVISERVVSSAANQPSYTRNLTYKKDKLVEIKVTSDSNELLARYNYYYNEAGKLTDETFESLKPEYRYTKDLYDYEDGELIRRTNTGDNTATEFVYYPDGLIYQTLWYNRFGQLERVYYNFYTRQKP